MHAPSPACARRDNGQESLHEMPRHYWIQTLGKGQIALDKAFVECGTRQRTHGKKLIGKTLFAECLLSGTRQRKATVTAPAPLTVALPSANPAGTQQRFFIFF